jgi:hypothetical protein
MTGTRELFDWRLHAPSYTDTLADLAGGLVRAPSEPPELDA